MTPDVQLIFKIIRGGRIIIPANNVFMLLPGTAMVRKTLSQILNCAKRHVFIRVSLWVAMTFVTCQLIKEKVPKTLQDGLLFSQTEHA